MQTTYGPTEVSVTGSQQYMGEYGPMTYLNFRSDDGARYFWRAPHAVNLDLGARVLLWGRLKEVQANGTISLQDCEISELTPETAETVLNEKGEPTTPFRGTAGKAWATADTSSSWAANIAFIIGSIATFIPLLGLLLAIILVPLLIVLIIILAVRLAARRGQAMYGTSIIRRNLIVSGACLAVALTGGGYQIAIDVYRISSGS